MVEFVTAKIKSEIAAKVAPIKDKAKREDLEKKLNAAHAAGDVPKLIRLLRS